MFYGIPRAKVSAKGDEIITGVSVKDKVKEFESKTSNAAGERKHEKSIVNNNQNQTNEHVELDEFGQVMEQSSKF